LPARPVRWAGWAVRYRKLIERSTLAAIDHALRAHGLSTDEFTEQGMAVLAATLITPVE
jgi:hypothetical protein